MFDLEQDFFVESLGSCLTSHNVPHKEIEIQRKLIVQNLRSGAYSTLVLFQVGSGECIDQDFAHDELKYTVQSWVAQGGKLVVHGEGRGDGTNAFSTESGGFGVIHLLRDWFGKNWEMTGDFYHSTTHKLRYPVHTPSPTHQQVPQTAVAADTTSSAAVMTATHSHTTFPSSSLYTLPAAAYEQLPATISVKACMISNVPSTEVLYAPPAGARAHSALPGFAGPKIELGMTLAATASYQLGRITFIGDVNAEVPSMEVIRVTGTWPTRREENWCRRKHFMRFISEGGYLRPPGDQQQHVEEDQQQASQHQNESTKEVRAQIYSSSLARVLALRPLCEVLMSYL